MTHLRLATYQELRAEIEIKRSRFITCIRRVDNESAARDLVAHARAEFPDARHHCSAFIVSMPDANPILHSSDDGEPSGTAGRPMLDVLLGAHLTDIAAVVIRYFGGTLLGTGGLVRAYSESVKTALEQAHFVELIAHHHLSISVPHATAGKLESDLRARGYTVMDVVYQPTGALMHIAARDDTAFTRDLAELTTGAITADHLGIVQREQPIACRTVQLQ
ncbi:YigZ family protein [Trueperella sp. LYQ141]|uniref:YigZ family protein n=1 Tax=Trueperella sp. LYQ141 TaxID=3391058 RepID=UPI003983920B